MPGRAWRSMPRSRRARGGRKRFADAAPRSSRWRPSSRPRCCTSRISSGGAQLARFFGAEPCPAGQRAALHRRVVPRRRDVSGATVIKAVNNYMAIRAATVKATLGFDYVLSPVSPVPTYRAEWETPTNDVKRPLEHISFTMPYNMSEQPGRLDQLRLHQRGQADRPADRRPSLRRSGRAAARPLVRNGARCAAALAPTKLKCEDNALTI